MVSFSVSYFARGLNFNFFGWPFGFWMQAWESLIIYDAITWFYARYVNKLGIKQGVAEA